MTQFNLRPLRYMAILRRLAVYNTHHISARNLKWDIPKIIKFKATTSLRVSCFFCIFKHSPQKTV
ncbi:hypothetical protein DW891_20300 [Bacteroides fragilis]|nr:hypothetical protein F3B26_04215 [Bacteroides fragilis]RHB20003.1 hypothetical protein DW891_20300 [Bacteroides fragilis]